MTYEEPTYIFDVPLGWEPLIDAGTDESEARTLYESERRHHQAGSIMLVVDDRARYAIWHCQFSLWPYE